MPTILMKLGWRFFFYANEGNEPVHVHCKKGDMECKYWLNQVDYDIKIAYNYNMGPKDFRIIRKILFENFDYINEQWSKFHGK